jgi:acyl-CoA reductase-like NAD-dependent aldehyde dehydrogenase
MFRRITISTLKLSSSRSISSAPDSLVHKGLWQTTGFLNGEFLLNNDKKTFDVYNPCNGKLIAKCSRMNANDVNNYAQISMDAFNNFKTTTAFERSKMLVKMADLMGKYSDDLALILSLESGKPFAEAKGEVAYARSFYELYSEEAKRISGEVLQPTSNDRRILTIKQPVGPAALITPWNFPSAMITRKVSIYLTIYLSIYLSNYSIIYLSISIGWTCYSCRM